MGGRVAAQAMSSLQEAFEAVVQFLEAAQRREVEADNPIVLAAIRGLGRCPPCILLHLRL